MQAGIIGTLGEAAVLDDFLDPRMPMRKDLAVEHEGQVLGRLELRHGSFRRVDFGQGIDSWCAPVVAQKRVNLRFVRFALR
jgi:hypothetical protein